MPTPKPPSQMTPDRARRIIGNPELYAHWPEQMRARLFRRAWSVATSAQRKPALLLRAANRPFSGDAA